MKDEELYEELEDIEEEQEEFTEEPDPDWVYFEENKEHFVYGLY